MKNILPKIAFAFLLSVGGHVEATTLDVQFEGQWTEQNSFASAGNFAPGTGVPVTVLPIPFVASVIFDPGSGVYVPPVPFPPIPGGFARPPSPFSRVTFANTVVTSSATSFGVANPYQRNGITTVSAATESLQAFNFFYGETGAPSQTLGFSTESYSSQPNGLGTAGWDTIFGISLPTQSIALSDIGHQTQSDFTSLLQNAFRDQTVLGANIHSYTILQGPGLSYPSAFSVLGNARIISITEIPANDVPEPGSEALVLLGLGALAMYRKGF